MKKVTGAFAAFLYSTSALWGATLLPNGQQQFIDANGKPYANGKVYFYSNYPTCTVLKNTYQDAAGSILNTNPVILSASGTATIFGVGAYCQVLKDSNNNAIWTKYTSDTSSASNLGWGGTSGGTANAQTVSVPSFASLNGQTFYFIAGFTNTSSMTLAINGGSPLAVVRDTPTGTAFLAGGEIVAGNVIGMTYASSTGQLHLITSNVQAGYTGEVRTFAMASCPGGWLYTDGSAVSATTYSNLYAAIGTTWGTSAGNVVLPDFRNEFMRGDGSQVVGTFEANGFTSHTHVATVTDPGHDHSYTNPNGTALAFQAGFTAGTGLSTSAGTTGSSTTGVTVANANTGISETRPDNYRVRFCIKY